MSSNVLRGLICFLVCLTTATVFAQKQGDIYSVKGTLVDSLLNESEPYATVRGRKEYRKKKLYIKYKQEIC